MFKKFLKGTPPKNKPTDPRSKEEINHQYTQMCNQVGQQYLTLKSLEQQAVMVLRQLDAELKSRNELDEKNKPKTEEPINGTSEAQAN